DMPQGYYCESTSQCATGLCCLKPIIGGSPTCQPLAKLTEQCTIRPVGGVYTHHCPCVDGARCDRSMYMCVPPDVYAYEFIMAGKHRK
ncbi:hypothetical protein MTO96_046417, partial [Rhipicephalus appendiculatus]